MLRNGAEKLDKKLVTSRDRAKNIEHFFDTIMRIVSKYDQSTIVEKLRTSGSPRVPFTYQRRQR